MSQLIPLTLHKILQSRAYTVIILGTENKKFAIYTEPQIGHTVQIHLAQGERLRPHTHDLLSSILKGLNASVLQIVISDVEDTIYFARLFLEQQYGDEKQILEVDARPSDCITLALIHKVPIFCTSDMLEKAIGVQEG